VVGVSFVRVGELCRVVLGWTLRHPLGCGQWIVLGLWLLVLSGLAIWMGDLIASTTNLDPNLCDQGAYLRLVNANDGRAWPMVTDGIRNPLFPWLLAILNPGSGEALFSAGLRFNVRLGAMSILTLGAFAGTRLAWLPAMTFSAVLFLVMLPISTYVGTEVLFYVFFFAAWVLAFRLFEGLTWLRCALFGAALALAYLAKPAVTMLVASFVVVGVCLWARSRRSSNTFGWNGFRPLVGAALSLVIFSAMIAPRAVDAWHQFRDPLQNTAARCFWADDWEHCYPILGHLNPRFFDRIPSAQQPSMSRYFARHGWNGAAGRMLQGVRVQSANVFSPDRKNIWFDRSPSERHPVRRIFPYRGFLLIPLLVVIGVFAFALRREGRSLSESSSAPWQTAFGALLVSASFCAYSWYAVIAPGARFTMALYLPVMFSQMLIAESLRRRLSARWSDVVSAATWLALLAAPTAHIAIIAMHPHFAAMKGAF